ncbi:MAG: SxtJ family membrane protein [Verrucomicrobiota bacterium]|nr:SxtJ family membrane protein [Verrucomicrobiota bacterium]
MVNPFKEVNWNPGPQERRKFALSLVIGFPCIAVVLLLLGWLRGKGWNLPLAAEVGGGGLAVGLLLLALPQIARPIYVGWYFVACCIGTVVGNLALGIVFFVLVTGLGLLMRALGRRPVRKTFDKRAATYWQDPEQVDDPNRYYRQF